MAARIRDFDWSATSLGPIGQWPQSQKTAVDIMLASGHAMQLAWGPDRTILYNDAYAPMLGDRHPEALGQAFGVAWPEIWDEIAPLVTRVFNGETVRFREMPPVMTRHGYCEETWWNVSYSPVRDESGAVAGLLNVTLDASAHIKAERERDEAHRRLEVSEKRQVFLLALSDALRTIADPEEIQAITAQSVGAHLGVDRAMYAEVEGEPGSERGTIHGQYVRPADATASSLAPFPDHFTYRAFGAHTMAARYRGGPLIVTDIDTAPEFDAAERAAWIATDIRAAIVAPLMKGGRLVAEFGVQSARPRAWTDVEIALVQDVAERTWAAVERARAEAALRDAELRFREFGEASRDVLWTRDADTLQWQFLTRAFEGIYGISRQEALAGDNYRNWLDLIVAEDRERVDASIARVRAGEHVTFDFRIARPDDGTIRWLRNTAFPITDVSGNVVLIGGVGHNATDLKRLEERQATLLAELQHRVRNILAVIRSIISRSDDGERSTEDYVQHLQGRIAALSRTQVLLTRLPDSAIDLEELIRDELLAQVVPWDQVSMMGPGVALSPKTAEILTLVVHELATNATKYGAFSRPSGRLDIGWQVKVRDGQDWLLFDWTERGVPIVDAVPRRRGFGEELIARRIPYEVKGFGSLEMKPGGIVSRIEIPLIDRDSILQSHEGP